MFVVRYTQSIIYGAILEEIEKVLEKVKMHKPCGKIQFLT